MYGRALLYGLLEAFSHEYQHNQYMTGTIISSQGKRTLQLLVFFALFMWPAQYHSLSLDVPLQRLALRCGPSSLFHIYQTDRKSVV